MVTVMGDGRVGADPCVCPSEEDGEMRGCGVMGWGSGGVGETVGWALPTDLPLPTGLTLGLDDGGEEEMTGGRVASGEGD